MAAPVARPLREQLLLATLAVLAPVAIVLTWETVATVNKQLSQLEKEARQIATAVAAHIDQTTPRGDPLLKQFLEAIELESGSVVSVKTRDGATVVEVRRGSGPPVETLDASAPVLRQPWTVTVGIPTAVAWDRAAVISAWTTFITGLATLIMLALAMLFLRRWLPSLKFLERSADRVGTGDLRSLAPEPMPSRELEHVRAAFGDMIERLREAREAIARQMEDERQMREEVESLQRQVIRQERLAAIGVLLSGIAHELNNPLQAISGSAEILMRDPSVGSSMRADLALIHKESARASGIIRNLSRFSRQQGTTPSATRMRDVIASVVELRQRRLLEQQIVLVVDDAATAPTLAVFTELQQVLLNFVVNAEQSIIANRPSDRRIIIRTRDAGSSVRVEVEDSGPGVPPGDESKLFQPFFTTKPVGEGTGLGLSVSYGIIRSLGGTIGYRRGDQGGAVFFFEVAAVPEPAVQAVAKS
jgi:C4-dicarboxylate-specific signal transduction histidine kinase